MPKRLAPTFPNNYYSAGHALSGPNFRTRGDSGTFANAGACCHSDSTAYRHSRTHAGARSHGNSATLRHSRTHAGAHSHGSSATLRHSRTNAGARSHGNS